MIDQFLQALGVVGDVVDTPGRFVRSGLAGRNPFESVFDPSQGASGRDLLEAWGILDPNTEGLDAGDVAGFGAEMLLDPLNLLSGAGIGKVALKARGANKAKSAALKANEAAQATNMAIDRAKLLASEVEPGASDFIPDAIEQRVIVKPKTQDEILKNKLVIEEARRRFLENEAKKKQPKRQPDKTINVREVPRAWKNAFPHVSDIDILDFFYGTRDQAASAIGKMKGLKNVGDADWVSKRIGESAGFNSYGFDMVPDSHAYGFVQPPRVDIQFVGRESPGIYDHTADHVVNTATHEPVHVMSGQHPNEFEDALAGIGGYQSIGNRELRATRGLNRQQHEQYLQKMAWSPGGAHRADIEENLASGIGHAIQGGFLKKGVIPPVRAARWGPGTEQYRRAVNEMTALLSQAYPSLANPGVIAEKYMDFASGGMKRRKSLVPAGPLQSGAGSPHRSFAASSPTLSPADEALAYATPYESPVPIPPGMDPRYDRMLAAILGYNVAAAPGRNQ